MHSDILVCSPASWTKDDILNSNSGASLRTFKPGERRCSLQTPAKIPLHDGAMFRRQGPASGRSVADIGCVNRLKECPDGGQLPLSLRLRPPADTILLCIQVVRSSGFLSYTPGQPVEAYLLHQSSDAKFHNARAQTTLRVRGELVQCTRSKSPDCATRSSPA
jgi:hypothetical protein